METVRVGDGDPDDATSTTSNGTAEADTKKWLQDVNSFVRVEGRVCANHHATMDFMHVTIHIYSCQ